MPVLPCSKPAATGCQEQAYLTFWALILAVVVTTHHRASMCCLDLGGCRVEGTDTEQPAGEHRQGNAQILITERLRRRSLRRRLQQATTIAWQRVAVPAHEMVAYRWALHDPARDHGFGGVVETKSR